MAQNLNKETFEIFESLNIFDSLLPYKLSNSIYNDIFPTSKIVVGTDKNPNQQHKDLDISFYSRQKTYKSYSNINNSFYDEFNNYSTDFPYQKDDRNIQEDILISEESKKFLEFFNRKEPSINQQNILGYDYGFQNQNSFITLISSFEEIEDNEIIETTTPTIEKKIVDRLEKIIDKKEIFNNTNTETKTESIIEKIWEKKQEEITQNNINNTTNTTYVNNVNENNIVTNVLNEKTLHNTVTENFKSENKTTLNIEQNIINEINNTITKLTTNSEKIVETKLEKVVKEIHHQNKADLSEAVMMMKKLINEEKFENKSIQKNGKKEVDKTLEDFLRS